MASFSCVYHRLHASLRCPVLTTLRHSSGPAKHSYAIFRGSIQAQAHISHHNCLSTSFGSFLVLQHHPPPLRRIHTASLSNSAVHPQTSVVAELTPGHLHIWWLHLGQLADEYTTIAERYKPLLTTAELEECLSTGPPGPPQYERVIARGFLRSVLAQYLAAPQDQEIPPSELQFIKNSHGKPDMEWPQTTPKGHRLRFNLTHTGGVVGVAVTVDALVGLDVELMTRKTKRDPVKLAARRFSKLELEELQRFSDKDIQSQHFMKIWTLKESYVKALGRGISAPPGLASFSFSVTDCRSPNTETSPKSAAPPPADTNSDINFMSDVPDGKRWQFVLLEPTPLHVAAVCIEQLKNKVVNNGRNAGDVEILSFEGKLLVPGALAAPVRPCIIARGSHAT